MHELPSSIDDASDSSSLPILLGFNLARLIRQSYSEIVNAAMLAHIEYIKSENTNLRNQCALTNIHFRFDQVKHDDRLQCI